MSRLSSVVLITLLAGVARGQEVPEYVQIDFSKLPDGTPLTEETEVGTQFSDLGVTFSLNDGGPELPIIVEEGDPLEAFSGADGSDAPLKEGLLFGLTDPVGQDDDPLAFRPIRIDFDPPVQLVQLWVMHAHGDDQAKVTVHFSGGGSRNLGHCNVGDGSNGARFQYSTVYDPAHAPITHVVVNLPTGHSSEYGYAVCLLRAARLPQKALAGQFIRIAQESSPGAADFENHVLGVLRPWRSPPSLAPTAADFYSYGLVNHGNESYGGPIRNSAPMLLGLEYLRSHVLFADLAEGLSFVVIHNKPGTCGGDGSNAADGHAEMRVGFSDVAAIPAYTVVDGDAHEEGDHYDFDPNSNTFEAVSNWYAPNTDGFVIGGLAGSWTALASFTELDGDPLTPPIDPNGLTSWAALSTDGGPVMLNLAADRRVQFQGIDTCIAVKSPVDAKVVIGGTVTLEALGVTTGSGGAFTYQWRRNGALLEDGPTGFGSTISGAHEAQMTITSISEMDFDSYDCIVTNACGSATSYPAVLSQACPGDVDGDGAVNITDLGVVLADYGCAAGLGNCPGDVNADGFTNITDLGFILTNFGVSCP